MAVGLGNDDGAHQITGVVFKVLNDVGFSTPAQDITYWNGQAMHISNYRDLDRTPEAVAGTSAVAAKNAAHLARRLHHFPYPA